MHPRPDSAPLTPAKNRPDSFPRWACASGAPISPSKTRCRWHSRPQGRGRRRFPHLCLAVCARAIANAVAAAGLVRRCRRLWIPALVARCHDPSFAAAVAQPRRRHLTGVDRAIMTSTKCGSLQITAAAATIFMSLGVRRRSNEYPNRSGHAQHGPRHVGRTHEAVIDARKSKLKVPSYL
jgi:hypothetical protein